MSGKAEHTGVAADRLSAGLFPTRKTLLERAQAQPGEPVWDEVLVLYGPFIDRVLRIMGFREEELDELRQRVHIKLWKGLRTYDIKARRSAFRTWLSTLIRNVARDYLRATRKEKQNVNFEASGAARHLFKDAEVEERIEREWQSHIVHLALQRMDAIFSGKAIEVFCRMMRGERAEQISEDLGIRLHSAYVLKNRVKTRMQQEVASLRRELEPPCDDE